MVHFCGDMVDDYDDVGVSIFYSVAAFNTLACNQMFLQHNLPYQNVEYTRFLNSVAL